MEKTRVTAEASSWRELNKYLDEGWVLTICSAVMMVLAVIILGAAVQKWISVMNGGPVPATAETA